MSDYLTAYNWLRTVRIKEVKVETPNIKTFFFKDRLCSNAKPGQFVMVWIPGVDEIPLSVSGVHPNGLASVTVAKVGEATSALHNMRPEDLIGIRGPFGNSFTLSEGKVLLVAGGTGVIPLAFLAEKLVKTSSRIVFLIGAKSKRELLFLNRIKATISKIDGKIEVSTEDGSYGVKGKVTELLEQALRNEESNMLYLCGPEPMIRRAFLLAKRRKIEVQASLERLMRCGIGICGSCAIGKYQVCKDGPVFDSGRLEETMNELGIFKRDFDGSKAFF